MSNTSRPELSYQEMALSISARSKAGVRSINWGVSGFGRGVTVRVGFVVDVEFEGDECFALVMGLNDSDGPYRCALSGKYGMNSKFNDTIPSSTISKRTEDGRRPISMASDGFFPGRDHVTYNDALAASKPFGMGDASQTSGKVDQMKFDDEAAGWDGDVVLFGIADGKDAYIISWLRHRWTSYFHSDSSIERSGGPSIFFDWKMDLEENSGTQYFDRLSRGRDAWAQPSWRHAETGEKITDGESKAWHASHGSSFPLVPTKSSVSERIPAPIPSIIFASSEAADFTGGKQVGHGCLPWLVEVSALDVAGKTRRSSAANASSLALFDDPRRFLPALSKTTLEGVSTSQHGPYISTWYDPFGHSIGSPNTLGLYVHKALVNDASGDTSLAWNTDSLGTQATSDEGLKRLMYGGTGEIRIPSVQTEDDESNGYKAGQLHFYSNTTLSKWEFRSDKAGVYSSEIDVIAGRQASAADYSHPSSASARSGTKQDKDTPSFDDSSFCPWVVGNGDNQNTSLADNGTDDDSIRSGIRPGGFLWTYRLRMRQADPSLSKDKGFGKLLIAKDSNFEIRAGVDPKQNRDGLQRFGMYSETRSIFNKSGVAFWAPGAEGAADGYKRGGLYVTTPTDDETINAPSETADYVDSSQAWADAHVQAFDAIAKYPQLKTVLTTMMNLLTDLKDKYNELSELYNAHNHITPQGTTTGFFGATLAEPLTSSSVDKNNTTEDDIKAIKSKSVFCGSE